MKTKIKSTISLTIDPKTKPLGINLIKHEQDLYTENCKMLMKEISEDLNKGIDTPCSWIRRFNIGKMSIFSPKGSTDLKKSLSKSHQGCLFFFFFNRYRKPILPLAQKDSTCLGATKPVHHNYRDQHALEPALCKREATTNEKFTHHDKE